MVVTFNVVVAVLCASVIGNMMFEGWTPVSNATWLYAVCSGFFVMLGHYFVFLSFRHASARAVAPFYYSFTLIAVTFGAVFFREYPNTTSLFGIAMIMACGIGVLYFEHNGKRA